MCGVGIIKVSEKKLKKLCVILCCCVLFGLFAPAYADAEVVFQNTTVLASMVHTLSVEKRQTEPITYLVTDSFVPDDPMINKAQLTVLVNDKKIPKRLAIELFIPPAFCELIVCPY